MTNIVKLKSLTKEEDLEKQSSKKLIQIQEEVLEKRLDNVINEGKKLKVNKISKKDDNDLFNFLILGLLFSLFTPIAMMFWKSAIAMTGKG